MVMPPVYRSLANRHHSRPFFYLSHILWGCLEIATTLTKGANEELRLYPQSLVNYDFRMIDE